jgi:hypothetical protein
VKSGEQVILNPPVNLVEVPSQRVLKLA